MFYSMQDPPAKICLSWEEQTRQVVVGMKMNQAISFPTSCARAIGNQAFQCSIGLVEMCYGVMESIPNVIKHTLFIGSGLTLYAMQNMVSHNLWDRAAKMITIKTVNFKLKI